MFEIHIEWAQAPGVRDPLLARTWARVELRLAGRPMTRYWSDRTESRHDGVYGSVLPLAQWVASSWWMLLFEGPRHHLELSARTERPRTLGARPWLRRHNLLTCREGMAYPDLAIYREEDEIVLAWFPDPPTTTTSGRFMGEGMVALDRRAMEAALESLMERVLERIRDSKEEEAHELRAQWGAILDSRRSEAVLCQRLAMLGQDPYAEDLVDTLETAVERLSFCDDVVQDLLSASTPETLSVDVRGATGLLADLPSISEHHSSPPMKLETRPPRELRPHQVGYLRAAAVRERLGISDHEALGDLDAVIERMVGEPVAAWVPREKTSVEAAIQHNGVAAIAAIERSKTAKRFLLGRALHHWLYATSEAAGQRLLTNSHDWIQAASRAFAAELLAPASALSSRLAGRADWERQEELAQEFDVSPMLIAHQIDNHRLA